MLFASRSSASILDRMPLAAEIDNVSMKYVRRCSVQFRYRSKITEKTGRVCRKELQESFFGDRIRIAFQYGTRCPALPLSSP
jgi:hypothetical protein